jgi:hypothetical protein
MRIIDPNAPEQTTPRHRYEGQSGVRATPDGSGWIAIKSGRFAGEFHGKRAFLAATRAAGSTARLA